MRKTIAARMLFSSQNTAPVHYSVRIDMSNLEHLRSNIKALGIKVTYTDIILKAVAMALSDSPNLNVSFENGLMTSNDDINIGIAVAIPNGLVVPVLRNVDSKSLKQISLDRASLVEKARTGSLTTQDMTGGSFTISNLGMYDIDKFNPIINPPEIAILGIGQTKDEVVANNKQIEIRPVGWFTLVADHQIIDGAPAAEFLQHLKQLVENPYSFLV
jgi:pyruvate dehydrogenase E2 component (dihydrolipoamide acetyltransferase)